MFSFIAHTKGLFNKVLSALEFQCHNIYDCDIRNTKVLTINAELITSRGGGGDCASDLIGFPLTVHCRQIYCWASGALDR